MPGTGAITFGRDREAALAFHLLAHLPLRRDAASLYDDTLPPRDWVAPLLEAYQRAPGRLSLHGLGLWCGSDGLERYRDRPPSPLRDDPGRRLLMLFLDAARTERADFEQTWSASEDEARARLAEVEAALTEPLSQLRHALWEQIGPTPSLRVIDCPALGPAGRGSGDDSTRVVAISCAEPIEHLLCQIFHEEVHPITDPVVQAEGDHAAQDTRAGQAGHATHAALEHAAIEVGEAVIAARAPQWLPAYHRWRARFA